MENIYKLIKLVAIVNLMLLGFTESQSAGNKASGCGNIVIKAEARTKYATTPGFPNAFPGDANCVWAIHSNPGKRIRLEFQKFYLLQPVDGNCEYHYVIVKSPFTLFSMGPYCGESGLPTIVSTGNLIYVELHTIVPVTTDNYQGFKLAFKETLESSSYELRPDNSDGDVIMTVDPDTMDVISPTAAPTTTPRTAKSTTKSWRFVPSRRPLLNTKNRPAARPRPRPRPQSPSTRRPARPSFVNTNNKVVARNTPSTKIVRPKSKQPVIKIEIIVAIAVGGLVAVAIIIMIALKMMTKKSSSDENRKQGLKKSQASSPAKIKPEPKSEYELPGMYMNPNQQPQYWYEEGAYAMAHPPGPNYPHQIQMEVYNAHEGREQRRNKKQKRNRRKRQR
ncbi:uncharacterized protein LOC120331987 [Styela clava]